MDSFGMGGFGNFIFCTRHRMFDVRHYMLAGGAVMTMVLVLVSQSSLQARVIDPGAGLSALPSGKMASGKLASGAKILVPAHKVTLNIPVKRPAAAAPQTALIPQGFKLQKFQTGENLPRDTKLTRLASIRKEAVALKFSPKSRKSCSIEAARAAANGDTSQISPCMTALLSGDIEDLVTLPEKMSAFFINTMNSEMSEEKKASVFINSMMEMMNAFSGGGDEKTPEKTAATAQ